MHLLAFFAFSSFTEMFAFFYRDGGGVKALIVLSALYCIRLHYTRLHSALVSAINCKRGRRAERRQRRGEAVTSEANKCHVHATAASLISPVALRLAPFSLLYSP